MTAPHEAAAPRSAIRIFARLLPALRPEWRGMIRSYVVGTVSALCLVAITVLTAWAVGHAVVDHEWPAPWWWIAVMVLVPARAVLTWHEMDVSHAVAYRVLARLRMALFDSYSRSVPARRREHSGRAAAVMMGDIEKLEFFYAHTLAQVGTAITVFLASLWCTAVLLPGAAIAIVIGGALVATTALYGARITRRIGAAEQAEREELSARIVDALGGLREILSYGLAPRVITSASAATVRAAAISARREVLSHAVASARELIVATVVIAVIALGAGAVLGDDQAARPSAAVLPALIALAIAGVSAIADAATTLSQIHPLTASAQRVGEGLDRAPAVREVGERTRDTAVVPAGPLGLRFSDVGFSYTAGRDALRGFSAEVAPGEHVGLTGVSGAGKSTLIALAARLWDPDAGTVELVDAQGRGISIADLPDADFRAALALVEQESRLFHGTVRDNLLRGTAPEPAAVPEERLLAVLERVGVAGWITLDDDLGEGGVRLSGGQQARLALARALVREPRVLILDEVTASLDPETEEIISQVIAGFTGTVLISSHRRETLARCTRVLRLNPQSGDPRPAATTAR